jgi:hypothetical protein
MNDHVATPIREDVARFFELNIRRLNEIVANENLPVPISIMWLENGISFHDASSAACLGRSEKLERIFGPINLTNAVQKLSSKKRVGRPPDPQKQAIMERVHQLKTAGKIWQEIASIINDEFKRELRPDTLMKYYSNQKTDLVAA